MAGLTPAHLLIILAIALIVIGPGKLPELGSAIGKSLREFQKATGQVQDPAPLAQAAQSTPAAQNLQPIPVMQPLPPQVYYPATPVYVSAPAQQPDYPRQYAVPANPGQPSLEALERSRETHQ